jgi:hypothetical protein
MLIAKAPAYPLPLAVFCLMFGPGTLVYLFFAARSGRIQRRYGG